MSDGDFARLLPHLERVDLPRSLAFSVPGQVPNYSYFIESGIRSIALHFENGGKRAEIGIVGREGMIPTALILNAPAAPFSTFMQVGGDGFRLPSSSLSYIMTESLTLRNQLRRYVQTMVVQTAFTALANATHRIEQRMARWILMCEDRSDGDTITLTHKFLAVLLAVSRQSVTTALPVLEGLGLIRAARSKIIVIDRKGLIKFAGTAYGSPEE